MTFGSDDAALMLEDLGEDVSIGGVTRKGLFRRADEVVLDEIGSGTIAKTTSVVIQRGVFPSLALDVTVTVGETDWKARSVLDLKDPRFVLVELAKPDA